MSEQMTTLVIPTFKSKEELERWFKTEYIFTGQGRLNGIMLSEYFFATLWDKFSRHPMELKQLICSSQDAFEGFVLGAYPVNP